MRDLSLREVFGALRNRWVHRREQADRTERQKLGDRGERVAATYLIEKEGIRIIERNWRQGRLEIDLVGLDGDVLVFVEVRARHEDDRRGGYASIGAAKRKVLLEAFRTYLSLQRQRSAHFRFDIVEIGHSSSIPERVAHYAGVQIFPRHFQ